MGITVNTRQAAATLNGLTINAGPGNSLGNYQSTQNIYVLGTPAGITTTIDATNGWHDISVGLPTDPRINTTGLPGTPLDHIQGPITVSGQGSRDVLTLWDWDSSTAQKTYAINSTNIAVTAINGVSVAHPVPISWQGNLSVVDLFGSAAADTYQFQTLPTGLGAIVVDGYYRANTFQSLLLIGGLGSGSITGGTGRSLLIADRGSASITGGFSAGGDILIGDYTTFDTMNTANEFALMSILAEWQSSDRFTDRFNDINQGTAYVSGSHLNGANVLRWGTTVRDDAAPDLPQTVTAAAMSGLDWFFVDANDFAVNFISTDHKDNI